MSKRYKNIHMTLSLLKFLVGLGVLVLVVLYIDPFQDPQTGVLIGSIGLLFAIWGGVYFVFYYAGLWWSDRKVHLISRFAYRASLLVAIYLLSNILFLVLELRNPVNGVIILAIFALLYRFLFHRPQPTAQASTSIDMIINPSKEVELVEKEEKIKPKKTTITNKKVKTKGKKKGEVDKSGNISENKKVFKKTKIKEDPNTIEIDDLIE